MKHRTLLPRLILPLAAGAVLVTACDDPVRVDDEHPEADGVVIMWGDVELLRYMHGDPTPTLALDAGTIYDVAITLLDDDGQPARHDDHDDDDVEVRVTVANTAILTWTPEPEDDDDHEFLETHGELEAIAVGSTHMTVCLLDFDHCDFEVTINVTVE